MKLKSVSIKGLNNKVDCDVEFHDDINIVTGMNGSGKTTLLKILWYAISGNIERIAPEITFEVFKLETDHFSIHLNNKGNAIEWKYSGNSTDSQSIDIVEGSGQFDIGITNRPLKETEDLNKLIVSNQTSSLFFPTFRRIEGGYSMTDSRRVRRQINSREFITEIIERDDIQEEFDRLSNRLSVLTHKFVCSISTHDIVSLLTSRYARASEKTNEYYLGLSTLISSQIEGVKSDIEDNKEEALSILSKLQKEAITVNNKRDELLKPFEVLSELVAKIFQHKGIRLDAVTLGESIDAIDSRSLSAGEKQMLSFLCYNTFYEDSIIFIDEPELSLHPDWQRRLFPNLIKQQASNQFIVATHSPFIYSKYADKEIILSEDKGE